MKFVLLATLLPSVYAEELKLEQAIRLALRQNGDIANAVLDVEKAGDRIAAYHTRLFPSLSLYALGAQQIRPVSFTIERGQLGAFDATGPIPNNDVKFSTPMKPTGIITSRVAQPLSGIYKTRLQLKSLDFSRQLTQEQARARRNDVVEQVKKLYYSVQQVESSLNVAREMATLFREAERLTAGYVVQQVALEADHLDSQKNLAKAEQDELTLSNQAASSKEQLNQLLGRDVTTEFTVSPIQESSEFPLDLVVARRRALEHRPEVRQAQLKMAQAQQDVKVKRADYIPEVSAEFNSMALLNYGSFLPKQQNTVGVSLTWEPFDWGRKRHEVAEKQRSVIQAKNTETDTRNKVLVDVNDKFRKLEQTRAEFRVARLSQKSAAERLRIVNRRYRVQAALFKNVLESQSSLQQAINDYEQTLAKLWTAKAEFDHAIGEDQ